MDERNSKKNIPFSLYSLLTNTSDVYAFSYIAILQL